MTDYVVPVKNLTPGAKNVLYAGRRVLDFMRLNEGVVVPRKLIVKVCHADGSSTRALGSAIPLLVDAKFLEHVVGLSYRLTEAGKTASRYAVNQALTIGARIAPVRRWFTGPDGKRKSVKVYPDGRYVGGDE